MRKLFCSLALLSLFASIPGSAVFAQSQAASPGIFETTHPKTTPEFADTFAYQTIGKRIGSVTLAPSVYGLRVVLRNVGERTSVVRFTLDESDPLAGYFEIRLDPYESRSIVLEGIKPTYAETTFASIIAVSFSQFYSMEPEYIEDHRLIFSLYGVADDMSHVVFRGACNLWGCDSEEKVRDVGPLGPPTRIGGPH